MKHIDTDKLQKELSKLSDEKLEKFMMLLPINPYGMYSSNWNVGVWITGIESGIYVTKKEFIKYCKEHNITTQTQWREHSSSGKRPSNIPSAPAGYYARTETWLGWPKELRDQDEFVTKKEFIKYCKEKNITTQIQWQEHSSSGKRQSNIPSKPAVYYSQHETWLGWGIELGTGNIRGNNKKRK